MNVNSPQTQLVVKDWLDQAVKRLTIAGVSTAQLDSELILAHVLGHDRTYLHAHPDKIINDQILAKANSDLAKRLRRIPLAYITGVKEFYGRDFIVTPDTLIPRPESETIIDILKNIAKPGMKLIDIGTGSGCLGISAKLESPQLIVTLADISQAALKVAKNNAEKYGVKFSLLQSDLLTNISGVVDIIIANLPYVDKDWTRSTETNHEPASALFADQSGMSLMIKLLGQAPNNLQTGGYLLLEADPCQHNTLIQIADENHLKLIRRDGYIIAFQSVSQ